jgi:peptidoglycan/xylan/chitin deacetylase (PgdA/CDA1 family)
MASLSRLLLIITLGFFVAALSARAGDNLLENPSFENGLTGWTATPPDSPVFQTTADAASMGKIGLRITPGTGISTLCTKAFPATPGQVYRFGGWVRYNGGRPPQFSLDFRDKDNKVLQPVAFPGYWPVYAPKEEGSFGGFTVQAIAPEGATTVAVQIQMLKSDGTGSTDVDDCSFRELAPADAGKGAGPKMTDQEMAALLEEIKSDPTRGKAPPMIVLKLDDFGLAGLTHGPEKVVGPDHNWMRIEDFVEKRKIKVGIGIVVKSLEIAGQPLKDWMKKMHDTGMVEFWCHGYDHGGWKDDKGADHSEFFGRPYADQKQHLDMCQKLMMDNVGFPLTSFGQPGGPPDAHFDAATVQAMQDDPYMKAWMYPQPMDKLGKELTAKGKVIVLDRVWAVNLESVVGHADFQSFLVGYAHNRGRSYFVLQGHPPLWGWGDGYFDEFYKIVDFLQSQGAVFMTPSECAAAVASGTPAAAPTSPSTATTSAPAGPASATVVH